MSIEIAFDDSLCGNDVDPETGFGCGSERDEAESLVDEILGD